MLGSLPGFCEHPCSTVWTIWKCQYLLLEKTNSPHIVGTFSSVPFVLGHFSEKKHLATIQHSNSLINASSGINEDNHTENNQTFES